MASVTVKARAPRKKRHRKVTLSGATGSISFDITNPEVDFGNLADEWAQQKRAGRKPLLQRSGEQLRSIALEAIIGTDPYRKAEFKLVWLAFISRGPYEGRTVALGYSTFEHNSFLTTLGMWVITDLRIRSVRRVEGTNAISQARVSITLTEASPSRPPGRPGSGGSGGGGNQGQRPRRHTVKANESLRSISHRYYGTPQRWKKIAKENKIRDPRPLKSLKVGRVLKLP